MNMKIKITESNESKIVEALKAVNGNATEHTYTTLGAIKGVMWRAERELESLGLLKKLWTGAKYVSDSGEAMPNAYKYSRKATQVTIQRFASGWFLTAVTDATIWNQKGKERLSLTETQDAEIVRRVRLRYTVAKPAAVAA